MKRFVTTATAMSLLFTACSSTAFSIVKPEVTYASVGSSDTTLRTLAGMPLPNEYRELQAREAAEEAQRQREQATFDKAVANTLRMQPVLERLKKTAGKTWYVFSGSSPSGWDCSGLVMWTYKNVGVNLAHSAGAQLRSGKIVSDPLPGDLVAYVYGSNTRYTGHVGIYLGDGKVIHSQKPGTRTRIESATDGVMNYGGMKTVYVRIIPMVPESDLPQTLKPSSPLEVLAEAHGAL